MTAVTLPELLSRLPLRLGRWAPQFLAAQLCYGVDALLLAAICDRESLGGEALTPKGPTGTGDGGHGRGLMQVDSRAHPVFVGAVFDDGVSLWKDPSFNILYAARLFARNLLLLDGDESAAIAAYNCGAQKARRVLASLEPGTDTSGRIAALNAVTAGGDYVSDVQRRRTNYLPYTPKGSNP